MPRKVFDWPIEPSAVLVHVPGALQEGALLASGYETNRVRFGARNIVEISLPPTQGERARLTSWLYQHAGSYFRVPVYKTPQVVDYDVADTGIPFAGDITFSDGTTFAASLTLDLYSDALAGENELVIDTSRHSRKMQHGHLFGIGFGVYVVRDISYSDELATVEITPPLRRDVFAGELVNLRPRVLCKADSMDQLKAQMEPAFITRAGSLKLREVIDNDFL